MERQYVHRLGCEDGQCDGHQKSAQQQQARNELKRKEHVGIVGTDDRREEMDRKRIWRRRLLNEIKKSVQAKDDEDEPE